MAELNLPATQQSRLRTVAVSAPRSLLSWEDWLTLLPALLTFGAVAFAVQQADLVKQMPPIPVTTMGGAPRRSLHGAKSDGRACGRICWGCFSAPWSYSW